MDRHPASGRGRDAFSDSLTTTAYAFSFDRVARALLLPLAITPATARVLVRGDQLHARFGAWSVTTPLENVAAVSETGPYSRLLAYGVRVSLADRGLTFATNARAGLCLSFHAPVAGVEPTGRLRHPGLTVTVSDPRGLRAALGHPAAR